MGIRESGARKRLDTGPRHQDNGIGVRLGTDRTMTAITHLKSEQVELGLIPGVSTNVLKGDSFWLSPFFFGEKMSNPYREHVPAATGQIPKHTYKYVLRKNYNCPVCGKTEHKENIHCYPNKRVLLSGHFWWRKYCPIEDVHHHIVCKKCDVSWIVKDEIEKNSSYCPICKKDTMARVWIDGWTTFGESKLCHPLKRLSVDGWCWKKRCIIDNVHYHVSCKECKNDWITVSSDQSEANPDFKEAYL